MKYFSGFITAAILVMPLQSMSQEETVKEIPVEASEQNIIDWRAEISDAVAEITPLDSEEGQKLLQEASDPDYESLASCWIPQLKSHCGAASAVVVQNALLPDADFTQMNLFTPETAHIITQDVVYRIGFTLEELDNMIETRSGLKTTRYHAGIKEGQYQVDAWIEALKKNNQSADSHLIINYPTKYMIDRRNAGGHFSPIAAYHEEKNQVLVLEINARRGSYWVDANELWESLTQVDSISGIERGWIVIENKSTEQASATAE